MPFGVEKLVSKRHGIQCLGYPTVKKCEDMFIRFDRIHEHDGQTDKHTDTA